jgi:uncharacterized membrane protein YqiK
VSDLFDAITNIGFPIWVFTSWRIWLIVGILLFWIFKGYRLLGIVFVPNDEVCMVTKKWGRKKLANGRIVACNKEAGIQVDTLTPGLHLWYWPVQFEISFDKLTVVPVGFNGHVTVIDGDSITAGRFLAKHVECNNFQDMRSFFANGGQKGPQSSTIRPGTYRINTKVVTVDVTQKALVVPANQAAIVTMMDGKPLLNGAIAGPCVVGHNNFQDVDAFVGAGGQRGLQTELMMSGTYYVNNWAQKVEFIDLQEIPIGNAGVVISYVGDEGEDVSGESFTHGHIVKKGQRGVWIEPMDPGRYALNTRTCHVEKVMTTNFVLNWIDDVKEDHGLDATLKSIVVKSMDGYPYPIEVSQVLHIAAENAPMVIARFGTVKSFITQVMDTIIDAWFRNAAQKRKLIDFMTQREAIQIEAAGYIKSALAEYDIEAVGTYIGDVKPPEQLMKPLQDKEIAFQQKDMFDAQQKAEVQRQEMEEAKALATTMASVITAKRSVEIAEHAANATIKQAEGAAKAVRLNGDAEAAMKLAVGNAEAAVLSAKVGAVGRENYTSQAILASLAEAKTPLVPSIVAGGEGGGIGTALMSMIASKMLHPDVEEKGNAQQTPNT